MNKMKEAEITEESAKKTLGAESKVPRVKRKNQNQVLAGSNLKETMIQNQVKRDSDKNSGGIMLWNPVTAQHDIVMPVSHLYPDVRHDPQKEEGNKTLNMVEEQRPMGKSRDASKLNSRPPIQPGLGHRSRSKPDLTESKLPDVGSKDGMESQEEEVTEVCEEEKKREEAKRRREAGKQRNSISKVYFYSHAIF